MKSKKPVWAVILTLALSAALLTGCTNLNTAFPVPAITGLAAEVLTQVNARYCEENSCNMPACEDRYVQQEAPDCNAQSSCDICGREVCPDNAFCDGQIRNRDNFRDASCGTCGREDCDGGICSGSRDDCRNACDNPQGDGRQHHRGH